MLRSVDKFDSIVFSSVLPSCTGVPTFSTYKVTLIAGPVNTVLATSTVGVCNRSSTISPEGVIVSSAGTSAARGGTSKDLAVVTGNGEHSCNKGGSSKDERRETHCMSCRRRLLAGVCGLAD